MKICVLEQGCEDVSESEVGRVDLVLTSPPYFNLEHYCDEATQSDVKWPHYDAWLRGFLLSMYLRAFASLDPGGVCLVNISNTPSNPELARLEEDSCAVAREAGFVGAGVLEMRKPGPAEGAPSEGQKSIMSFFKKVDPTGLPPAAGGKPAPAGGAGAGAGALDASAASAAATPPPSSARRKAPPAAGDAGSVSVKHPPARVRAEHAHRPEKIFVFRKPADAKP